MATRKIETTIELDGEQKFKQALSSATREMRVMESELKAVSAAYNTNGDAATYYASKQQNLRSQISQQREIIAALERAVEDAGKAYGTSSSQVDGYAIRLNNARTKMARLEKELDSTDREVEELGRDSVRAGRQLEQGIGDGAEKAEDSVRSLMATMQEDIASIKTSTAVSAVSNLWNMATGAYSSVAGFVDSTAEYRQKLSFLEQNAATAGFDFSTIKTQLTEAQGITRDASSAIETLSNLLATGMDESQMERAIDSLAGAVISFPDTLKFESLADGLQETIATGSATGQFAELLERLGVDVEAFNKALEDSETESGDLEIALAYLAAHGMKDVYEQWQKNNGVMAEAQQTQAELEAELAEFGGHLEQYIVTPVKGLVTDALTWVNEYTAGMKADMEAGNITLEPGVGGEEIKYHEDPRGFTSVEEMNAAAEKAAEEWEEQKRIQEEMQRGVNALVAHSKSTAAQTAPVNAATFYGSLVEQAKMAAKVAAVEVADQQKNAERALIEAMTNFVTGWKTPKTGQATDGVTRVSAADMKTILGYQNMDVAAAFTDKISEAGETAANALRNFAKSWESPATPAYNQQAGGSAGAATWSVPAVITGPSGETYGQVGYREDIAALLAGLVEETEGISDEMESAGEDAGAALEKGFSSAVSGLESSAYATGSAAAAKMAAGLMSQISYVAMAGASVGNAAASGMAKASAGGSRGGVGGIVSGAASVINAVLSIDGQTFGRVTAPYVSSALAVQMQ